MKHYDEKQMQENILYLEALSEQYPNIQSAAAEMINLHAILDLPKGTEHFLSDIHGEHEAFRHILNNASGSISAFFFSAMNLKPDPCAERSTRSSATR